MANRVCWDRAVVQYATQVDVGGLEIDDPHADAVFHAIHQPLPVRRIRDVKSERTSGATENDVLKLFTQDLASTNEPLLLFVTGQKGTGKSHMVRWLRSRINSRPDWHVVYIEKRNTSLKRVIEQILQGIESPKATQLRVALRQASIEITTDDEAMHALLAKLNQLVKYDRSTEIQELPGVLPDELLDLRRKADRLLGDFTFRKGLCQPKGPIERIVRLARVGTDPSEDVEESDLHLAEKDLRVDPSYFEDTGQPFQHLIGSLVSHTGLRTEIAALCDSYLPRAKAEVFTGQTTDLLEVFEEVRREIALGKQELCLFIEDLVLLHGIDKQLAQALTVPASKELCKIRAVVAVTSGYLSSVGTFTDRGTHFTLDIDVNSIGADGLQDFVGRYLNVARLSQDVLMKASKRNPQGQTPNACLSCPDQEECRSTFGKSSSGHGLYPFNSYALDRLISLASPEGFRPREILREVIRAPLETAENELPLGGAFPSDDFAHTLDENRQGIPVSVRTQIRQDSENQEAELSLRAFYAETPPDADDQLIGIAHYLDVKLVPGLAKPQEETVDPEKEKKKSATSEIEKWANGGRLTAPTANKIRKWICESVVAELQNGPYGLTIRKPRTNEWQIGAHLMRVTDVDIERAQGAGVHTPKAVVKIEATDENAMILKGVLAAIDGKDLASVDRGAWFFRLQNRIAKYTGTVAQLATDYDASNLGAAVQVLAVLRNAAEQPGLTLRDALPSMLLPSPPADANPMVMDLLRETKGIRDEALLIIRDHATAAKGSGKPTILDAGKLVGQLRMALRRDSVEGPFSAETDAQRILRSLETKQRRASRDAWAEVTRLVRDVARSIQVDEDLTEVFKIMDRLVAECHGKGMLPRADSRLIYDEARATVELGMMDAYRRLSSMVDKEHDPGDLWLLVTDPGPKLKALSEYGAVSQDLLRDLEVSMATSHEGGGTGDPELLIKEFRGLADDLHALTEME